MVIERNVYKKLCDEISRPEISILLGPRQVGKTFLLTELKKEVESRRLRTRYYNLEIPFDLMEFNKSELDLFTMLTTDVDVIFIDEFHYLKNASKLFKAIFDSNKNVKIFASGSSSIEIHKHLKESLAGRRLVTRIAPLIFDEYKQKKDTGNFNTLLEEYLTIGGLPGLIHHNDFEQKIRLLNEILETYIQKDIKSLIKEENIRAFNNLLYLLVENQGSQVSVSNLSNEIGLTSKTVDKYLSILEHTYICHSVYSYSKNIGNELKKSRKIYFYDLGMRNALLKDFSCPGDRKDIGVINESYIFLELKNLLKPNMELKFWRNKAGQEIDFVILKDRRPFLIEVKTSLTKSLIPSSIKTFIKNYPETSGVVIFSSNYEAEEEYLGKRILFQTYHKAAELMSDLLGQTS